MYKRLEQTLHQRGSRDSKQALEKISNITSH